MKPLFTFASVVLVFGTLSCAPAPPVTASEIADRLVASGLAVTTRGVAPQPKGRHVRFDEAIRLEGEGIQIDVIRIEDNRVYDLAAKSMVMLDAVDVAVSQEEGMEMGLKDKPDFFQHQPFVVVVRQAPEPAAVLAELDRMFGKKGNAVPLPPRVHQESLLIACFSAGAHACRQGPISKPTREHSVSRSSVKRPKAASVFGACFAGGYWA